MKTIVAPLLIFVVAIIATATANPLLEPAAEINGRITHGEIAEEKQFPYQVGLKLYTATGAAWCGGSIISDRWILTAAHCTEIVESGVDVYLGAWNRTNTKEPHQQIIYTAKRNIIIHADWNSETLTNDISLIKLPVKIEYNEYVKPATLPKLSSTYATYAGDEAITSGWGRTTDSSNLGSDLLRWIEIPIISNSACNVYYLLQIKPSNICIKTTGGYSTCNGDSGGPLVLANSERTLVGITSFGLALGCEVGWPGVFTRVTSYLDWIEQQTGVANK